MHISFSITVIYRQDYSPMPPSVTSHLYVFMFLFSSARGMPPQSYRQDYSPVPPLGPFSSSPPGTAHSQMYLQPSASSTYPQHGTSTGAYPSTGAYTGTGTGPGSLPTPHYSQQQMTGSPRYMPLEIQHYRDGVTVSHCIHAPRNTTLQRRCHCKSFYTCP